MPTLLPGDAAGTHTLRVRDAVRALGFQSEIFVEDVHRDLEDEAHHFKEFATYAKGSVIMYQLAIGSVLADYVLGRSEPLVVNYHNLTPSDYYRRWDASVVNALDWGRAQLRVLADRAALAITPSAFNEAELIDNGYTRTAVVPILIDVGQMRPQPDPHTAASLDAQRLKGGADILFVGRLAPNKAQEDLVKALYAYRRAFDPDARLRLIGRPAAASYGRALSEFIAELGLSGAVDIIDWATEAQMAAHYECADVVLSASEHEGFWVPALEAMHHGVPIVAYAAAAVPDTLGAAGLLLESKAPSVMAAAVHRVICDPALRSYLVDQGRQRLSELTLEASTERLLDAIGPLLGLAR